MGDALGLMGLALRAGKAALGEKAVEDAVRSKKARLVCSAFDMSPAGMNRVTRLLLGAAIPHIILPYTKDTLGASFGRETCAVVAVTDIGIAAGVARSLAEKQPDKYGEQAGLLEEKNQKIQSRKKIKPGKAGRG